MAINLIYMYGCVGIVSESVKGFSCIKIGDKYYRSSDKRIECSSSFGGDFLINFFMITIIIIMSLIIPLILFI